jgi:hypothetical protein
MNKYDEFTERSCEYAMCAETELKLDKMWEGRQAGGEIRRAQLQIGMKDGELARRPRQKFEETRNLFIADRSIEPLECRHRQKCEKSKIRAWVTISPQGQDVQASVRYGCMLG